MTNYYKIIDGLDGIESPQLRDNIITMYSELIRGDYFNRFNPEKITESKTNISKYLYRWVMGVGFPISISGFRTDPIDNTYEIEIVIDYKVFSAYNPHQDDFINLKFTVSKKTIRDLLITDIC